MSSASLSKAHGSRHLARIVRMLTLMIGAAIVLYALSDDPFYGGEPGFGTGQVAMVAAGVLLGLLVFLPLSWNTRVLALVISVLFALFVAEVVAEVVLAPRFRPAYESDERLIFKLAPDRTVVSHLAAINGGGTVVQHINKDGFRGKELDPAGSAFRVVVYGDSFIHAYYAQREQTFPYHLGQMLQREMNTPLEVINAGVSSYGPDQILRKLEGDIPVLEPDLVIVSVFAGNDYGDLLRNKLYKVDDAGRLQPNSYELAKEIADRFDLSAKESVLKRALRGYFAPKSDPFAGAADPLAALLDFSLEEAKREYEDYIVQGSNVVTNTHIDYFSGDVSLEPDSPSARYRVRLMAAILRKIRSTTDEAQVPLVFLFIPHPLDVGGQYRGGHVDPERYPHYDPRNLVDPLEEMARGMGIPFVSLHDTYRKRDAKSLYLRGGDDHWNPAGQRLAAEVMAEYLIGHGLLKR